MQPVSNLYKSPRPSTRKLGESADADSPLSPRALASKYKDPSLRASRTYTRVGGDAGTPLHPILPSRFGESTISSSDWPSFDVPVEREETTSFQDLSQLIPLEESEGNEKDPDEEPLSFEDSPSLMHRELGEKNAPEKTRASDKKRNKPVEPAQATTITTEPDHTAQGKQKITYVELQTRGGASSPAKAPVAKKFIRDAAREILDRMGDREPPQVVSALKTLWGKGKKTDVAYVKQMRNEHRKLVIAAEKPGNFIAKWLVGKTVNWAFQHTLSNYLAEKLPDDLKAQYSKIYRDNGGSSSDSMSMVSNLESMLRKWKQGTDD